MFLIYYRLQSVYSRLWDLNEYLIIRQFQQIWKISKIAPLSVNFDFSVSISL